MIKKSIYFALIALFSILNNSIIHTNASSFDSKAVQVEHIEPAKAMQMVENNEAILIDVRNGTEYDEKNIPNAILINKDKLINNYSFYKNIIGNKKIILHCKSGMRASNAAKALQGKIDNKVFNLKGGIEAWDKSGMPIIKLSISIMRQVQIAVGALTVIFALLGFYKNKHFLIVNIFIGCGLFFAGATGFCGLAKIIKMMPWN